MGSTALSRSSAPRLNPRCVPPIVPPAMAAANTPITMMEALTVSILRLSTGASPASRSTASKRLPAGASPARRMDLQRTEARIQFMEGEGLMPSMEEEVKRRDVFEQLKHVTFGGHAVQDPNATNRGKKHG